MESEWWVYPFMFILAIIVPVVTYMTGMRMGKERVGKK
jgi:hypothetical protein